MVDQYVRWDFIGLSTDAKPTSDNEKVTNGSTYYESDTSKYFVYYNGTWYEKTAQGGGATYTAGDNITIENNVISATVPEVKQSAGDSTTGVMSQKATTDLVNGRVMTNEGAPTTSTVGTVGQLLEDTTNGKLYQCTAVDTTDPQNPSYTWVEVGGASGPTVVQNLGTSTTDVMSQNAVTSSLYGDPSSMRQVKIGKNTSVQNGGTSAMVVIGESAKITSALGSDSTPTIFPTAIGVEAVCAGNRAMALGAGAECKQAGSVAIGEGAKTSVGGEVNIGSIYNMGYQSSKYRIITGVHDGQDAHDAATVAQGNTLATSAPTTSTEGVLGQLYTDTTNMHTYQCTAISGDTYTWQMRW